MNGIRIEEGSSGFGVAQAIAPAQAGLPAPDGIVNDGHQSTKYFVDTTTNFV
jgi:hypothetical protein